jgi:threonine/homoserine/homoserine lactone efflux protein
MLESLFAFAGATILLALSPGPDNIYVLTQSLVNGSRSGIATTAGLITGCIFHTTLIAFGVSALIVASPQLFFYIKILGALYLLYLAYKVYKSDSTIELSTSHNQKSLGGLYKQGIIMNLLNPKVMIFFLAFFPAFLWEPDGNTVQQFYILGGIFMFVSFLVFGSIAVLAGYISKFLKEGSRMGAVLKWLQIVVFVGIAVYILL